MPLSALAIAYDNLALDAEMIAEDLDGASAALSDQQWDEAVALARSMRHKLRLLHQSLPPFVPAGRPYAGPPRPGLDASVNGQVQRKRARKR
jgi:hypothetical protein